MSKIQSKDSPSKTGISKEVSMLNIPKGITSDDGMHLPHMPPKLPTKIKLQSSEGKVFELDYNVAKMCQTIKSMVEESENPISSEIPIKLSNISNEVLAKIIEYLKHYHNLPPVDTDDLTKEKKKRSEIKDFDLKFVQSLDKNLLFELIMASNFLYIRSLIDLLSKHAANTFIKGKSIKEVRDQFNIKNDFNPAEEQRLKEENKFIDTDSC